MRRPVRYLSAAAALVSIALLAASTVAGGAAGAAPLNTEYVALGDSYTAGPLIQPQTDLLTCVRSGADYPALLAAKLDVQTFHDVSCSSATTSDFTNAQPGNISGTAAPQYDALSTRTTLVTIGIGGNDIGLVGLAESCLNILPAPLGKSCAAKYTAGGVDVYANKIAAFAPTYGTVVDAVHRLAPNAKVVLVGYPTAIRNGGCYPVQPILAPDATYIQAKIDQLNAVMKQQALAHGASYADLRTSTVGHDSCARVSDRWLEGLIPSRDAFPLHPNALAMQNAATVLYRQLQSG